VAPALLRGWLERDGAKVHLAPRKRTDWSVSAMKIVGLGAPRRTGKARSVGSSCRAQEGAVQRIACGVWCVVSPVAPALLRGWLERDGAKVQLLPQNKWMGLLVLRELMDLSVTGLTRLQGHTVRGHTPQTAIVPLIIQSSHITPLLLRTLMF